MIKPHILIIGVTSSGKGRLAFELAKSLNAEIISVDSMKVYRRMNIGTAKPPKEIRDHPGAPGYHLIDVVEPDESFSVARFLELAQTAIGQIENKGKHVVAVGGTALYIKSMLFGLFEGPGADEQIRAKLKEQAQAEGLKSLYEQLQKIDPDTASRVSANDERRIIRALEVYKLTGKPISSFQSQWNQSSSNDWTIIGLRREKTEESKRINARVKKMIDAGLVDEVKGLLAESKPLSSQARCAIGYAEIIAHLSGKTTLDEAIELIKKNSRKLAKAQRTWFKTFKNVHWLDVAPDETIDHVVSKSLELLQNDAKSG
jgi:tRNA dimethylallyltransferase